MSHFIDKLDSDVKLNEVERAVLKQLRIDNADELLALLASFPSLGKHGLDLPRLSSAAYGRKPSAGILAAAKRLRTRPARLSGAKCPRNARFRPGYVVPITAGHQAAGQSESNRPARQAGAVARRGGGRLNQSDPIDLRLPDWQVRDQGDRPTCVSFSLVACREHHAAGNPRAQRVALSEQYLFWAIKTDTSDPGDDGGTLLEFGHEALAQRGTCSSVLWPYDGRAREDNPTHADDRNPSAEAHTDAQRWRHNAADFCCPGNGQRVIDLLRRKRVAAITLPVFVDASEPDLDNWTTTLGWEYGTVFDPPPWSIMAPVGHAVCITGYIPDDEEGKGGYFIFRNSYGTEWGRLAGRVTTSVTSPGRISHAPEPGYGHISATYIDEFTWEVCGL